MLVDQISKIIQDDDFLLFNVTLFTKVVDEFCIKARDRSYEFMCYRPFNHRFIVRDFKFDSLAIIRDREEFTKIATLEKEQWTNLLRLLKVNFGDMIGCAMHLKNVRVYVESVLRYGLPADFQVMIIKVKYHSSFAINV